MTTFEKHAGLDGCRLLFFGIICLLAWSCNEPVHGTDLEAIQIDLNEQQYPGLQLNITGIIPLESKDSSIIGRINRIQFFNDNIYVLDWLSANTLFLFDNEGRFKKKIPNGKGPGECIKVDDFFIDHQENKLVMWDQFLKRMSYFDPELNYLTSSNEDLVIRQFEKMDNDSWMVCRQISIEPGGQDYYYFQYSRNFDSIEAEFLPIPRELINFSLLNPISREPDNEMLLASHYDQNIYVMENGDMVPRYYLDFGDYNVRKSDFASGDYYYPTALAKEGKRVVSIDQLINTNDFFAFSFLFKGFEIEYLIYSKKTGEYWYSNNLEASGLLPKGKLMCVSGTHFILSCEPIDFNDFCKTYPGNIPSNGLQVPESGNVVLISFELFPSQL